MARKAPVTRTELEAARARLETASGETVTLYPGGGGGAYQWAISPAFGQSFGAIGTTKREALATLEKLTHKAEEGTL